MPRPFPPKAVCVFAKPPRPRRVKTRLLAELTAQEAAEVHLACVRDTARMAGGIGGARKWFLVAGNYETARQLARRAALNRRWCLGVQVGRDLGARLDFCFQALLGEGMRKVAVIGTDTPWMGAARILRAFELLDRAEVVLGPTEDGGYYLVAARRHVPEMFRGIRWGTSRVLRQTLRALRAAGVSYRLLPRDFDLDRPEDLRRVAGLLRKRKIRAPELKRWILDWSATSGSSRRRPPARRRKKRQPARA